jgi:hypothetical protein
MVWVALLAGAASIVLYALLIVHAYGEDCGIACTSRRFVPYINGVPVQVPDDFDKLDCEIFLDELDSQTPAFSRLECIGEGIARTES